MSDGHESAKDYQTAGFINRAAALIVDSFIVFIPYLLLSVFLGDRAEEKLFELLFLILFIFYNVIFLWRQGATLGKKLFKIKVVLADGRSIGLGRALLRETIGKIVSGILNLGYAWVIVDKKNQGFHDKIADTLVLRVDLSGKFLAREKQVSGALRRWLLFLLVALIASGLPILVLFYLFLAQPLKMVGQTMTPAYQHGDNFFAEKISYRFGEPRRGDVVVFKSPVSGEKNLTVKRTVGLPGETIKISGGLVYINGQLLTESYLPEGTLTNDGSFLTEDKEFIIPKEEYFVMGDNRDRSSDSRNWGTVPREKIIGKAWFKY